MKPIYEEDIDVLVEETTENETTQNTGVKIIIYNDDFNTFDWVIESLVKICKHTTEQAEQLSLMIHFKGKAVVKTGEKRVLKPMKDALVDRGLSAVMEQN
jgi:ATP-dependent Clp protease adaptor protein ClpS